KPVKQMAKGVTTDIITARPSTKPTSKYSHPSSNSHVFICAENLMRSFSTSPWLTPSAFDSALEIVFIILYHSFLPLIKTHDTFFFCQNNRANPKNRSTGF